MAEEKRTIEIKIKCTPGVQWKSLPVRHTVELADWELRGVFSMLREFYPTAIEFRYNYVGSYQGHYVPGTKGE